MTTDRRNEQIVRLRECGVTYRELGEKFDITKQRVRQIVIGHQRKKDIKVFFERLAKTNPFYKLPSNVRTILTNANLDDLEKVRLMSDLDILRLRGIGKKAFYKIKELLNETDNTE